MGQRIGGVGLTLPIPQNYYPSLLPGNAVDLGTGFITLNPGDVLVIPAGEYTIEEADVSVIQWFDPVMTVWREWNAFRGQAKTIFSDGVNFRLANLTGCPVSATVAGGGSGFTQATAVVTANVGGSTWKAIVGGSLSVVSITNAGANYTMPPIAVIPDGPVGLSVPATANTTITAGTLTSVALVNVGAGYTTAPTPLILVPNPADPNIGTITNATITMGLTNAGKITAALCTNNGNSLATISALTLTASGGAGAGATITPNVLQVVTGMTIGGAGTGISASNEVTSVGGIPVSVSAIGNPVVELGLITGTSIASWRPRKASMTMAVAGGSLTSVSAIYDTGMFLSTPTALLVNNTGVAPTAAATVTFTMGGIADTITMTPAA